MFKISLPSTKLLVFASLFIGVFASAQTPEQAQKITASYDKAYLQELAAQSLEKSVREKKEAVEYARARNIPISYTTKDSAYAELQRVLPDGTLIYYKTDNVDAAISTRVNHLNTGGSTGYNLDGQNMIAYVWDGGHPRVSHQEYDGPGGNNRVSIGDSPLSLHYHAAHVIGTIGAYGGYPQAKGMAPRAKVRAYDWTNDVSEATAAAAGGMLLSNHSYGFKASDIPDKWFGAYREDALAWDNIMFNAPYYLMVNSAGNDGGDNISNGAPLAGASGYDKLSGSATAKNNLVVAAANDANVDSNGGLISVSIASFSSQGPTDDFRIKPDITGNGVNLTSTYDGADNAYGTISGTSMSSPNVTGSLLLLQQHYHNVNGSYMRAATLKGLALHTADDAGPVGPDAVWGWGLLNTKKAAETITLNGSGTLVQELIITQGQTITLTVDSDGIYNLMASISWTDRAGTFNNGTNSPTAALVNDLDIRVKKGVATYYPWRLTGVTTNSKDGDNKKDPYERVDVESASGIYTITITHKGTLVGGSQAFSFIVTGLKVPCVAATVPQNVRVNDIAGTTATVSWDPIPGATHDIRYREVGATTWTAISDIHIGNYEITGLDVYTEYEVEVRSKCSEGTPSSYSDPIIFTTRGLNYCDSFAIYPDNELFISNVSLNTINNSSSWNGYSDFTNISTDLIAGQTYTISITSTTVNPQWGANYAVWIDYNRNGIFESGERIYAATLFSNVVAGGSFVVPANVDPLSTTMRVMMSNDVTNPGPCEVFNFGEVEDYTIHLNRPHTDYVYNNNIWTPRNPAGQSTSVDNIHIINGTPVFSTNITAYNITIDSGATLKVQKILTIAGDLANNGSLVFVSGPTGNGELGAVPGSSTITGNATVQRYMQNKRSYRMVSSAVTTATSIKANWQEGATSNTHDPHPGFGTHITGATTDQQNGFDGTATGSPSMFYVPNGSQAFAAIENTNTNKLIAGNPYLLFVRGDRSINLGSNSASSASTLQATGALYYGQHVQNFSTEAGEFIMFGNPYQSAVDITSVFASSTNINTGHYYVYDPNKGNHGGYVTVVLPAGTNTDGLPANKYLQPGQAAQAEVSGAATVIFNEINKAPGNFTATNRNPLSWNDMLTVQLYTTENYNSGRSVHDSFGILFAEGNTNELTPADAIKPMNFYENLGINHNGTYLSMEHREMPQPDEVFPLYIAGYQYSLYTLKMTLDGLDCTLLYLDDNFTGTSTILENGETVYNFSIAASDPLSKATDRFSIRTEARLRVEGNNLLAGIRLFPNPLNDNTFYIAAPRLDGETVVISVNDVLGREVFNGQQTFSGARIKVDLSQELKSGIYLVTLSSRGESQTLRIIKR